MFESLVNRILFAANEDYCGLWEVYEEAKDLYCDLSREELIAQSKEAILYLLDLNWIKLYLCQEPLQNESVIAIDIKEIVVTLSNEKYWGPPNKGAISVRLLTTKDGEAAFSERFLK